MNRIALIGLIGSGKGTTSDYLTQKYKYETYSFAGPVKDVLSTVFGWDRALLEGDTKESRLFRDTVDVWWSDNLGIPHFTPRIAMQLVGTEMFRGIINDNIWVLNLLKRIENKDMVIVSDARFPNEIESLRNDGFTLIRVDGRDKPEWYEIAKLANSGCAEALEIMKTTYKSVHISEWAWIGTEVDHVLKNDSGINDLYNLIDSYISIK